MPNLHLLTQTFSQARHASGTHQFNGLEAPLTLLRRPAAQFYSGVDTMGFLIEQAGGLAFEEDHPILEIQPRALHQRVGVTMGDRAEVERILGYFSA